MNTYAPVNPRNSYPSSQHTRPQLMHHLKDNPQDFKILLKKCTCIYRIWNFYVYVLLLNGTVLRLIRMCLCHFNLDAAGKRSLKHLEHVARWFGIWGATLTYRSHEGCPKCSVFDHAFQTFVRGNSKLFFYLLCWLIQGVKEALYQG
jgi:hypothetical protein